MTSIVVKGGADFSANAVGFRAPVPTGLAGWFFIGARGSDTTAQGTARTVKNLAFNSYSAALIGSPTLHTGYATFTSSNYMQTDIPETASHTMLAVVRNPDTLTDATHYPAIMGTLNNAGAAAGNGIALVQTSGTGGLPGRLTSYNSNGTPPSASTVVSNLNVTSLATGFEMVYVSANNATGEIVLGSRTESVTTSGSFTAGTRLINPAGTTCRIGALVNTSVATGSVDIAFAAVYTTALTSTEITTIYNSVAAFLTATYSITI